MNLGKCLSATVLFAITGLALTGSVTPTVSPVAATWLVTSGIVGLAIGDGAYFRALLTLGVRRAILLLSTAPVFTAIGAFVWLGEAMEPREALAILAVVAGVVIVVREREAASASEPTAAPIAAPASMEPIFTSAPSLAGAAVLAAPLASSAARSAELAGVLFGLLAALGQAGGSLMSRVAMASGVSALDAARVRMPAGLIGILILSALGNRLAPAVRVLARPRRFAAIAGAATIGTYLGIWLSQIALGHARSAAIASTLLATSPLFALPLGRWISAERITTRALGGTLVACVGLVVLTLSRN